MGGKVKITWQVDDGYCGGSRPQYLYIDDDELSSCETEEEKENLITESIQEDFEQVATWIEINREGN